MRPATAAARKIVSSPTLIDPFESETANSFSNEKCKKILKQLFVEPFKTVLFRATTNSLGLRLL